MSYDLRVSDEVDASTRAQVAEFLRMTPAERLRSLVSTIDFIQRARKQLHAATNDARER